MICPEVQKQVHALVAMGHDMEEAIGKVMRDGAAAIDKAMLKIEKPKVELRLFCVQCGDMVERGVSNKFCTQTCADAHTETREAFRALRESKGLARSAIRVEFGIAEGSITSYETGTILKPKWSVENVRRWMQLQPTPTDEELQAPRILFPRPREDQQKTQRDVAEYVGTSLASVGDFESGKVLKPKWANRRAREWLESL